jgi:S1-C subfamily serine protease
VRRNSAADRADLRPRDVITGVNDKPVHNSTELTNFLGLSLANSTLRLEIVRERKRLHFNVGPLTPYMSETEGLKGHPLFGGMEFGALDYESPLCGQLKAVVLLAVSEDGVGAKVGLKPGDIIVDVDQRPVQSPKEIAAIAKERSKEILLHIIRGDQSVYVVLKST